MPIEVESPEERGYDTIRNNLSESSFADAKLGLLDIDLDLRDLVLCYGDHRGKPSLRSRVAAQADGIDPSQVIVTPGAAAALFFVASSVLGAGDRALIASTNYATNLETPRLLGAQVDELALRFEGGFQVDVDRIAAALRDGAKLISLTCPHNPTGTMLREGDLRAIVALVEQAGAWLLVDETYRDLAFGRQLPLAATLSPRVISVSSLSKAYGLPGIRIGWSICRDPAMNERLLAAKEQVVITNSVVDEEIADRFLAKRDTALAAVKESVGRKLGILKAWFARQQVLEWVPPEGGVVCFPRFKADVQLDVDAFYRVLDERHGTIVGPGHWFDADRRSMRIGFGWPTEQQLTDGLAAIEAAAAAVRRSG
jgi:aspartate/methionine/tyrosine aminotransferase